MISLISTELLSSGDTESSPEACCLRTAFGCQRDYLSNRFVYLVISPRARGLTIGVNLNPDKQCNFNCVYCEVDRRVPGRDTRLEVDCLLAELRRTLAFVHSPALRKHPRYRTVQEEFLTLRDVALSGDGEPTLCPSFAAALEAILRLRCEPGIPFFNLVLLTNTTGFDLPAVRQSLALLHEEKDQVWAKLDAGTPAYMARVNRSPVRLEKVLENILLLGRQRPLVIQSLFLALGGYGPAPEEIEAYISQLKQLRAGGARISEVQIYSASRPSVHAECTHLPLKTLSQIARRVRAGTGLKVEFF